MHVAVMLLPGHVPLLAQKVEPLEQAALFLPSLSCARHHPAMWRTIATSLCCMLQHVAVAHVRQLFPSISMLLCSGALVLSQIGQAGMLYVFVRCAQRHSCHLAAAVTGSDMNWWK
jgi:hypothetical protein